MLETRMRVYVSWASRTSPTIIPRFITGPAIISRKATGKDALLQAKLVCMVWFSSPGVNRRSAPKE